MHWLSDNPAAAYRRVELNARIETSSTADLTRICLEEAAACLGQALIALERQPDVVPQEPLLRAQVIAIWLARSVKPDHPLCESLIVFYGGIVQQISGSLVHARPDEIARMRGDLLDILAAAG